MNVRIADEVVIATSPVGEERWGYYQFPSIEAWDDGTLGASYNVCPDAAESYGTAQPYHVSRDGGRTWARHTGERGVTGLLLPNGDRLAATTPTPYPLAELDLPQPIGRMPETYGGQTVLYRVSDLPAKLQVIWFTRLPKGSRTWVTEQNPLHDPLAVRYSIGAIFPIVWWGNLRVAPDGSLLAGIYPGLCVHEDGTPVLKCHVFFYRSTDAGHSWTIQGRIPYQGDAQADPHAVGRDGFTEPTYEILRDGSLLCVMRTTDGLGSGPMYATRSTDLGRTWSPPAVCAPSGVLPQLLLLKNGVLVLSSGRPGVELRFSASGRGDDWSAPHAIIHGEMTDLGGYSCGYTHLLATGPDRFLIVYSDFRHRDADGQRHKAIKVREVVVARA